MKKNKNNNSVAITQMIDSDWKKLCRIGGIASFIFLIYAIITMVLLTVIGGNPTTVKECFTLLQNNRIIGLLRLDLLTILFMPLYYLIFFGIYAALRKTDIAYTTLAIILVFVGVTLILATPSVFSLLDLSDKYAAATTDAEKAQLLAAGEAIIALDTWHSTSAMIGGIILEASAVFLSTLMLKNKIFSSFIGYLGIISHGLDLLHFIVLLLLPELGVFLVVIAGIVYVLWFPLIGKRLLELAKI